MNRFGRRRSAERGSGRSLPPLEARKAWKALCEKAGVAARAPEVDPQLMLTDALRAAPRGSYPLPTGDARAAWADDLREQLERYKISGPEARRLFAPALLALADSIDRLTHALSTEEAARYRSATGQRDD